MKTKNNLPTIILIAVAILITLIFVFLSMFGKAKNVEEGASASSSSFDEQSDVRNNEDGTLSLQGDLKELVYDGKETAVGSTGYNTLLHASTGEPMRPIRQEIYEDVLAESTEAGYNVCSGSKVYNGILESEGTETEGKFIFSGYDQLFLNEVDTPYYNILDGIFREQGTGVRIYCFNTEEKLEAHQKSWDDGQAILAGEQSYEENSILLNGCLTDLQYRTDSDGNIEIPLRDIMKLYSALCEQHYNYENGYYTLTLGDGVYYEIPTSDVSSYVSDYLGVTPSKTEWTFRSKYYPLWSENLPIPDAEHMWMDAMTVSRMTGWRVYTGTGIIHIVTDELDATDTFKYVPLGYIEPQKSVLYE